MTPTFCETCANVEVGSRRAHPATWLCVMFPRLDGHGYVSETYWAKNEPFMRCHGINGGKCPMYQPARKDDGLVDDHN